MQFFLVDRITSLEAGKSVSAVKNLSLAEEYLADHFPGFPVMPGVMMLETLVQACGWLIRYTEDFKHSTILLRQAKALKFNNFVTPGRTLIVNASVTEWGESSVEVKGAGTVDGQSAVSAKLVLDRFNLGDKNSELAESDRRSVDALRGIFGQIWKPGSEVV
jgi:3-hydroxyacyl-[acyl-carrier-protein] dehydratase